MIRVCNHIFLYLYRYLYCSISTFGPQYKYSLFFVGDQQIWIEIKFKSWQQVGQQRTNTILDVRTRYDRDQQRQYEVGWQDIHTRTQSNHKHSSNVQINSSSHIPTNAHMPSPVSRGKWHNRSGQGATDMCYSTSITSVLNFHAST